MLDRIDSIQEQGQETGAGGVGRAAVSLLLHAAPAPGFSLLFVAELVANSPHSEDHLGVLWVFFDLGSQAIDV